MYSPVGFSEITYNLCLPIGGGVEETGIWVELFV